MRAAADRRLLDASEDIRDLLPAATRELERLLDKGKGDPIRLASVKEIFDRAGLAVVNRHEVKVSQGEYTFDIVGPGDDDQAALA